MKEDVQPINELKTDNNPVSTDMVEPNQPTTDSKKPGKKKKTLILLSILVGLVLAVGAWYLLRPQDKKVEESLKITIGDITITQDDLDRYAKSVDNYKKENPTIVLEKTSSEIAIDDLVMNAALIKEAEDKGEALTKSEINKLLGVVSSSNNPQESIDAIKNQDNSAYYQLVNNENIVLKRKLSDTLIGNRSIFYVSSTFDAPYFRSQPNEQAVAKLHTSAKEKLNSTFLPLFKDGVSKEEIAKKADVNYTVNSKNNENPEIFFDQIVYAADYIENYQDSVDDSTNLDPKKINNSQDIPKTFKDLENVDYGTEVIDLRNTVDEVNKLEKVGDTTTVFASKTGSYMIIRLEKKSGGEYGTWTEFLEKYKDESIPKDYKTSLRSEINKSITLVKNEISQIKLPWEQTAEAAVNCGQHRIQIEIQMIDTDTWQQVNGPVSIRQSNGVCSGGSASGNGYASFTGTCYGNPPTWDSTVPSGYNRVGAVADDWTPANVNQRGNFRVFIHVRRTTTTIRGNSTLVKNTGTPFGTGASISGHQLGHGGDRSSSTNSNHSDSWTVNRNNAPHTVHAYAPTSITEGGNGRVWNLSGPSHKEVNVPNDGTANFTFTYTPEDTPTCTGTDGQQYPIGDSRCTPTSNSPTCTLSRGAATVENGSSTTIGWTTSNATSLSINQGIGSVTPVASSGSTPRTVDPPDNATTIYTGTVTGSGGTTGTCTTQITSQASTTEPTDSPYLRVFGNDVITGSRFPNDTGSCDSTAADNTSIRATTRSASNQWYGASSEFAVFDYGNVDQFFSNSSNYTPGSTPPLDLTFGNYNNGRINSNNNFGGSSGLAPCLPDYFGDIQAKDPSLVKTPGTANIPTTPIPNGQRRLIVVEGDVYITENISYQNESWNSVDEIPNFYLIVKGNISIAPNVTRLDGIYVAQPTNDAKGEIFTCANGLNTRFTGSSLTDNCETKLTINGSFIAKKSYFDRTYGRLSLAPVASSETASSNQIAEVFNFSPEAYLTPLNSSLETTLPYEKYDYIVSLPPVL